MDSPRVSTALTPKAAAVPGGVGLGASVAIIVLSLADTYLGYHPTVEVAQAWTAVMGALVGTIGAWLAPREWHSPTNPETGNTPSPKGAP